MQQIKKILVPTDFSPASWEATLYAIGLCRQHQSKMTLLHVVPGRHGGSSSQVQHMSQKLSALIKKLNANDIEGMISGTTKVGKVSTEILQHLEEVDYDVVIMGVNGNGGLSKDLGRNAREISEKAVIPVRLVPNKKSD